ncbi:hypothetical protein GCM10023317_84980 [Actinopolymorpha pittospori]
MPDDQMSSPIVKSSRDVQSHAINGVRRTGCGTTATVPGKIQVHDAPSEVFQVALVALEIDSRRHHTVQEQDRVHGSAR